MSHRLVVPKTVSKASYEGLKPTDIRRAAMDLLARREHSRLELQTKLQKRFRKRVEARVDSEALSSEPSTSEPSTSELSSAEFSSSESSSSNPSSSNPSSSNPFSHEKMADAIQLQIDRLTEEGLQSDYRLAGSVIRSRSNRGHGPVKIGGELRQKGVSDSVISAAFLEENIDWFEKIKEVSHRKFGDELPANSAERAKRGRFLQQRGFSWDQIQSI